MKHIIPVVLAAAISLVPLGAIAGEPCAPGQPGGPMPPGMAFQHVTLTSSQRQAVQQIMTQAHQQLEQLHTQARSKVLGDISPAHRTLLAQVVGSLAISPNPDRDAAIRQLNAALSPSEAQAVISTHNAAMAQMQSMMESTHQKFQALLTQQQRSQMPSHGGPPNGAPLNSAPHDMMYGMQGRSETPLTAGDILLHLASPEMEDHLEMMGMGHPM